MLCLAIAVGAAGCDDLLTETPHAFLTTEIFYETPADAESAITATYQPLISNGAFNQSVWWAIEGAADNVRINPTEPNASIVQLTRLTYDANNPYVTAGWRQFYTTINRANVVLARVPGIDMPETRRSQILGEAKFLRALSYFYLVRLYGDVPLVRTEEEALDQSIARSPREEVYQLILQDAQEAAAALPMRWGANDLGRASRGAALALLADVHLWRQEWPEAAEAARQIIDSGEYALEDDYLAAFEPGSQNGREEIFALQAGLVSGGPGTRMVEWYYPYTPLLRPGTGGGWGTLQPTLEFYASYIPGDYRKDAGYFTETETLQGEHDTFEPHVHKYRPSVLTGQGDVNIPMYRYADVLLMYAEALNESGSPSDAVKYVNQVRARARNGAGTEDRTQPADLPAMSQADLRAAIFQERGWELAHEGKRWFDVVRRGPDFFLQQMTADPTATDVQVTDMLWPIPQGEIELNPNLSQNSGY
jgi:hypothetical protein